MASYLHKLGVFIFTHPWRVIATWIVILALAGGAAASFYKQPTNAISIPGTEAQKALDELNQQFPAAGRGSAKVVFATPDGKKISDYRAAIQKTDTQLARVAGVESVISPFDNPDAISESGQIAYAQLQLTHGNGSVAQSTTDGVSRIVTSARQHDLTVDMDGDIINKAPSDILGVGEIGGVVLALVVLSVTLGSLVAAGLPILVAVLTIGVSMGGLFGLSRVIDISATTPVLAVMLGLAVGIDYSLFIVSKYRRYLLDGADYETAVGRALGTAGNAVIFAALTVVIALAALTVVRIPFMSIMGLAGAATIAMAALVAVTLLPALLGVVKQRIFARKTRHKIQTAQKAGYHGEALAHKSTFWYKWGAALTKHPIVYGSVALVVIAAIAWPVHALQLGLPTDQYAAKDSTERQAYDLLTKGFGVGFNAPLAMVVQHLEPVTPAEKSAVHERLLQQYQKQVAQQTSEQTAAFQRQAATATTPQAQQQLQLDIARARQQGDVAKAKALKQIDVGTAQLAMRLHLQNVADAIATQPDIKTVQVGLASSDGSKGVIQVIPDSPPDSDATRHLIKQLRDPAAQKSWTTAAGVSYAVTGSTALQTDINDKLAAALPIYLLVVVGLSLILLIVAFRSILVPIKATLGFLLSVAAMLGALVMVFQWGWFGITDAPSPITSFIPIIATGVLFGLAMDYEYFLVTSMHESYHRGDAPKQAVVDGFGLGSKVVTAAGTIMVAVFAGFITNGDATIQTIGFGLAFGILIDAFLVRMTIVPAVMTLLGKAAWWLPGWLDRILPHVSIEGEDD